MKKKKAVKQGFEREKTENLHHADVYFTNMAFGKHGSLFYCGHVPAQRATGKKNFLFLL